MTRGHRNYLIFLLTVLAVLTSWSPAAAGADFSLTILHVNDTHSHLEPVWVPLRLEGQKTWVRAGGYARLATKIKDVRAKADHVLVLHAGDMVQGTLYFTKFLGRADVDLLNLMGIDAMAVGNHEFDRGPGLLKDMAARAGFPILAANLDASGEPELQGVIRPYIIREMGGERIGVIGLITPDTAVSSSPGPNVKFGDPIEVATRAAAELEKKGVNKIVALGHIGLKEAVDLARGAPGLDVVICGHSHTLLGDFEALGLKADGPYPIRLTGFDGQPVVLAQAWEWAKVAGVLKVDFDAGGRVGAVDGRSALLVGDGFVRADRQGNKVEVTGDERASLQAFIRSNPSIESAAGDPEVLKKLAAYSPGVRALEKEKVADVAVDIPHAREPGLQKDPGAARGSLIAPLVAESMLWKVNQVGQNAHLALQNAGGVRISLSKGPLTVAQVYRLLPFNNTLHVLELTGAEIKAALEHGLSRGGGAFPYVAGARYVVDFSKPSGGRVTEVEISDPRNPEKPWARLNPEKKYRMVTNGYLAGGGDAYRVLKEAQGYRYDTGFVDAQSFMEYAWRLGRLTPPAQTGVTVK